MTDSQVEAPVENNAEGIQKLRERGSLNNILETLETL